MTSMQPRVLRERKATGKWQRLIIQREFRLLKQEQLHLVNKQKERELTHWEQTRLEELIDESMALLSKFGELSLRAVKRAETIHSVAGQQVEAA